MTQSQYERLLFNATALIEGLRPHAMDDRIAPIFQAIQPTYEFVLHGRNPLEIEELIQILDSMNVIVSKYKRVSTIIEHFDDMREQAPAGTLRLIFIEMILYHSLWQHEQAKKEGRIHRKYMADTASAARDAYDSSPERMNELRIQAEQSRRSQAAAAAAATSAAEAAAQRQALINGGWTQEHVDDYLRLMAFQQQQQQKGHLGGKKKSGKKGGKKSGKKSHKKSHKRRH